MGRAYEEVMNTSSGVSGELGSVKNCAIAARASGEVRHCSGVQAEARTWQAGLVGVTVVLAGHSVVAQHLQHVGRSLEIAIEGRVAWRAAGVRAQRAARGGVRTDRELYERLDRGRHVRLQSLDEVAEGVELSGELDGTPRAIGYHPP